MGDGKKLRETLHQKNMTVRRLSEITGIKKTTLYSIIQKDSRIKLDYAIVIANVLDLEASDISSYELLNSNYDEDIETIIPKDLNDAVFNSRAREYIKDSLCNLVKQYGPEHMKEMDGLIRAYYQLDDEGREVLEGVIKLLLVHHEDARRREELKSIGTW